MEHPETHLVTKENGPRPAGPPDRCFYCKTPLGQEHAEQCVCRLRTVVVRAVIEYTIDVPAAWTPDMINFSRNESSWCGGNAADEIAAIAAAVPDAPTQTLVGELVAIQDSEATCLCPLTTFSYVREATAQDEERSFGQAGLLRPVPAMGGEPS